MSIYGIAVSALNAAQAGLTTTSNNIANANTPGYSRQSIIQIGHVAAEHGFWLFRPGRERDDCGKAIRPVSGCASAWKHRRSRPI